MAETIDKVIAIVGYLLAIFIPIVGLIVGVILYFVKKEDPFYQKHAKYIIIVAIAIYRCNSYMGYRRFISCYGHAGLKQPLIKI